MIVRIVNSNGTNLASGLFAKCPLSHCKFPCRSTTLSIPDCKNKIARKAETRSCSKNEDITDIKEFNQEARKAEKEFLLFSFLSLVTWLSFSRFIRAKT